MIGETNHLRLPCARTDACARSTDACARSARAECAKEYSFQVFLENLVD